MLLQATESQSDGLSYDERVQVILDRYEDVETGIVTRIGGSDHVNYYNRKTEPISMGQWVALTEYGHPDYGPTSEHYKVLRRTFVGGYVVSTIWLGLNHAYMPGGAPLIFETMVFAKERLDTPPHERRENLPERGLFDLDMDRYSWEQQALEGHEQMVMTVRASTGADDVTEEWPA